MTELQVKAAQLAEEKRHNIETEKLTKDLNAAQATHLRESDRYTEEHYKRGDTAGLISANANAMNASTNRKNYEMQYDIEYGWTGTKGYPSGMPLSAQRKNAELELLVLDEDSGMPAVQLARDQKKSEIARNNAEVANKVATGFSSVLNATFGKGGVVNTIKDLE